MGKSKSSWTSGPKKILALDVSFESFVDKGMIRTQLGASLHAFTV